MPRVLFLSKDLLVCCYHLALCVPSECVRRHRMPGQTLVYSKSKKLIWKRTSQFGESFVQESEKWLKSVRDLLEYNQRRFLACLGLPNWKVLAVFYLPALLWRSSLLPLQPQMALALCLASYQLRAWCLSSLHLLTFVMDVAARTSVLPLDLLGMGASGAVPKKGIMSHQCKRAAGHSWDLF